MSCTYSLYLAERRNVVHFIGITYSFVLRPYYLLSSFYHTGWVFLKQVKATYSKKTCDVLFTLPIVQSSILVENIHLSYHSM